jgi:hypothetical protein
MKELRIILAVLASVVCCSISNATITNVVVASDGDGAIDCVASFVSSNVTLNIVGNQYWSPGHMVGDIYTDSAEDPTLKVINSVDNATNFPWTDYHVNIFMDRSFTLSNAVVYTPGGWTATITQQPAWNGSKYEGKIDYYAGTAVAIGDTLDFGYKMFFSGASQYSYCQEMIPTPEPGTVGLVTISGLLLGGFRLARRWRRR